MLHLNEDVSAVRIAGIVTKGERWHRNTEDLEYVVLCACVCDSLTKMLNLITVLLTGITDAFNYSIFNV